MEPKFIITVVTSDRRRFLFTNQSRSCSQAVLEATQDGQGFMLMDTYNGTIAFAPGSIIRLRTKEEK